MDRYAFTKYHKEIAEDYIRMQDAIERGKINAIERIGNDIVKSQLELGEFPNKRVQAKYDYAEELKKRVKQKKFEETSYYFFWVTVCPPDSVPLSSLMKCVDKLLKKKWLTEAYYAYEQRGSNMKDMGKGTHVHLLIKRPPSKKPSHAEREIRSTFSSITQIVDHKNMIKKFWDDKFNYITGIKTGEGKSEKQVIDVPFRIANNLQSYYSYNSNST